MLAPAAAKRSAIAWPIPLPAPVTSATLPFSSISLPLVSSDDQVGHQARPSRLMRGTDPRPGIAVEVLVDLNQVVPRVVVLKLRLATEDGPVAVVIQEESDQPGGQLVSNLR